jgi:O-antigen/teichoic acid export membrane protein
MLSIDDFGRVLIVINLFVLLEAFVGLRLSDVMFRFFLPLKERGEARALQGVLLLCLGLSLATGLLISGGMFALSPWLAERFYRNPQLAPLFRVYGLTVLVSAFREVYEPVLRIHDRFTSVVVPQVLGALATAACLVAYFAGSDAYDLRAVVAAFALGALIQTAPPLALALRLVRPSLAGAGAAARALSAYRPELLRCLFHSNLSGYLRIAINPGDLFLLGLFSTPAQVALYGLARQLTAPLGHLQTNAQIAVAPEVISLVARREFARLRRMVGRFVVSASALGALSVGAGLLAGRVFISWISGPEYAAALPVFNLLLVITALMLIVAPFRPLSVGLDLMRWYNLGLLSSAAVVLAFAAAGRLDAAGMAYAQLAGALLLRILCNAPVWARLGALAGVPPARDGRGEGPARAPSPGS